MKEQLYRLQERLPPHDLVEALRQPGLLAVEPLASSADFSDVDQALREMADSGALGRPIARAVWDARFAPLLHRCLSELPRRDACDLHFWHWLCVFRLPDLVWLRWTGVVPEEPSSMLRPALAARFLGSDSLNGISRNTLARLWWCAETLVSESDGYALVSAVLESQDFYQAIFDRQFSLYPPAARACVRALKDVSEEERRRATRDLNHYLSTIVLEALDEDDIVRLLRQ